MIFNFKKPILQQLQDTKSKPQTQQPAPAQTPPATQQVQPQPQPEPVQPATQQQDTFYQQLQKQNKTEGLGADAVGRLVNRLKADKNLSDDKAIEVVKQLGYPDDVINEYKTKATQEDNIIDLKISPTKEQINQKPTYKDLKAEYGDLATNYAVRKTILDKFKDSNDINTAIDETLKNYGLTRDEATKEGVLGRYINALVDKETPENIERYLIKTLQSFKSNESKVTYLNHYGITNENSKELIAKVLDEKNIAKHTYVPDDIFDEQGNIDKEKFARYAEASGVEKRFVDGFTNIVDGAVILLKDTLSALNIAPDSLQNEGNALEQENKVKNDIISNEGFNVAGLVGELVTALLPMGKLLQSASAGGRVAKASAFAGTYSGLSSAGKGNEGKEIVKDTAIGAAAGGILQGVFESGRKLFSKFSKKTPPNPESLKQSIEAREYERGIVEAIDTLVKDKQFFTDTVSFRDPFAANIILSNKIAQGHFGKATMSLLDYIQRNLGISTAMRKAIENNKASELYENLVSGIQKIKDTAQKQMSSEYKSLYASAEAIPLKAHHLTQFKKALDDVQETLLNYATHNIDSVESETGKLVSELLKRMKSREEVVQVTTLTKDANEAVAKLNQANNIYNKAQKAEALITKAKNGGSVSKAQLTKAKGIVDSFEKSKTGIPELDALIGKKAKFDLSPEGVLVDELGNPLKTTITSVVDGKVTMKDVIQIQKYLNYKTHSIKQEPKEASLKILRNITEKQLPENMLQELKTIDAKYADFYNKFKNKESSILASALQSVAKNKNAGAFIDTLNNTAVVGTKAESNKFKMGLFVELGAKLPQSTRSQLATSYLANKGLLAELRGLNDKSSLNDIIKVTKLINDKNLSILPYLTSQSAEELAKKKELINNMVRITQYLTKNSTPGATLQQQTESHLQKMFRYFQGYVKTRFINMFLDYQHQPAYRLKQLDKEIKNLKDKLYELEHPTAPKPQKPKGVNPTSRLGGLGNDPEE